MTPKEQNYRDRARLLLLAAGQSSDPTLRRALAAQSARINAKAIHMEVNRRQANALRFFTMAAAMSFNP